ncbi:MAG: DUF421 domain-containing protein [Firmicutes bacterium]|nr:DUF421 domain-containing protein [Bacillota bacterium]
MNEYLVIIGRVFITWPLLYVVTVLMGKRNMGQLPVLDFIIVITIGSIAGADLADPAVPHGPTLATIVAIALIQFGFTWLKIRSRRVRQWANITPTVIFENGRFLTHNLAKIRYSVNDILPLLRKQGVFNLSELEYAIIEPDGNISVLKKAESSPLTPAAMGLKVSNTGLPWLLVADGRPVPNIFKHGPRDRKWLETQIRKSGLPSMEDVYIAQLEGDGSVYMSPKRSNHPGRSLHY